MRFVRLLVGAFVAVACFAHLAAQDTSPGYHTVACFKLKPDSAAAFRKYVSDEVHKVAQGRVDDGELTQWYLLRSVIPQGESTECDYMIIAFYPKMPHLLTAENLAAAIKQAGITLTPDDYFKHRDALSKLVSASIFRNMDFAGAPKKGDYFEVSYMKVAEANFDDWIDAERKIWKPLAEALIKDGKQDGWSVNVLSMPNGVDQPYQGVTVDVYPSMDAVFADDPHFIERFQKVHPDLEFGFTIQKFEKLRTQSMVELYELEDMIAAK